MYLNRGYVMKNPLADVDPSSECECLLLEQVYLGASVLMRIVDNPDLHNNKVEIKEFRMMCRSFLVTTAKQIKRRFDHGNPVLSRLGMLDPVSVLGHRGVREQSLVPLAKHLPRVIAQDDLTLQKQDIEWKRLGMDDLPEDITKMVRGQEKIKDKLPDKIQGTVKILVDNEGVLKIWQILLQGHSLPHANADCKQRFSDINRVKSKDRNKLKTQTVRDILLAKQNVKSKSNQNCVTIKPSKSMIRDMNSQVMQSSAEENTPDIHMEESQEN